MANLPQPKDGLNGQPDRPIDERKVLVIWLLFNVFSLSLGWSRLDMLASMGVVTALGQWMILQWILGLTWPWVILGPIVWFYFLYGSPVLAGVFYPLLGIDYGSWPLPWLPALIAGLLIGLCEAILLRARLQAA